MAKRTSLRGNIAKPDVAEKAAEAARIAEGLTKGKQAAPSAEYLGDDGQPFMETVSYHLPVELIEEITVLADLRLRKDKRERREARRRGEKPQGQTRRSGSAVVREALTAHRDAIKAEIEALRAELDT